MNTNLAASLENEKQDSRTANETEILILFHWESKISKALYRQNLYSGVICPRPTVSFISNTFSNSE